MRWIGLVLALPPLPFDPCKGGVSKACCTITQKADELWLAKLVMASGTSAPFSTGDYMECENTPDTRYVLVRITTPMELDFKHVAPGLKSAPSLLGEVGLCVPHKCAKDDVHTVLNTAWSAVKVPIPVDFALTGPEDITPPGATTYGTLGAFAALIVGVLCATVLQNSGSRALLVQAFSLSENWGKLTGKDVNPMTGCLNGIRVISISWIVLGHTFLMAGATAGYSNEADVLASYGDKSSAFLATVASAELAVDTFFFLSGYLLVVSQGAKLQRALRAKVMPGMYTKAVLYRYLRLTPSVAMVLLFFTQIAFHMGDGPFFPRHQNDITRRCWSWWTELVYVQNYYPWNSDDVCMGWTWYLGNEMIFFMVGFPLLLLYPVSKRAAWVVGGAFCIASLVYSSYVTLDKSLGIYLFDHQYTDYCYWLYSKPHHRLPAYLVGMGAAILLPANETFKASLSDRSRSLLRIGACLSTAALVFLALCSMSAMATKDAWTMAENYAYIVWARPVWAVFCAIVASACVLGALSPVNTLLKWPGFTPLARLTYGCYLCHPVIIKTLAAYEARYYTYSHYEIVSRWLCNLVLSFGAAAVLFLTVERPCLTLTNYMVRGPSKQQPKQECLGPLASPVSTATGPSPSASPLLQ